MEPFSTDHPLVYTVRNLCKVCFTCVRECPVKAIRIINGQAEVIAERCIACGNCVKVCSQGAKMYHRSRDAVISLIRGPYPTVACLAPSFPAEFSEYSDHRMLVGMLRALGFNHVTEVSFGADLVARRYRSFFRDPDHKPVITSDCPAIVNYIRRYHPDLVKHLAPVASPAMAMSQVVRERFGSSIRTVFIGPCVAKKSESEAFNEVLTFSELRELFEEHELIPGDVVPSEFDPPFSGKGALFPVTHGLLQTVEQSEGFRKGEVIAAEGKSRFTEAIRLFREGVLGSQHLELLCCEGCIQGPGMSRRGDQFLKRKKISEYVLSKLETLNLPVWEAEMAHYDGIDMERDFTAVEKKECVPEPGQVEMVLASMGRAESSDRLNCGACGYETCYDHASAVVNNLAEKEMCLPYTIEKLHESIGSLNDSNRKLADTRQALKQSEKLAGMGQVSAGIAHELNNPLGIITLYSSILREEISEENPIRGDISIIAEQAERCRNIVGGLLNFARKNQVRAETCDLVEFISHSLKSVIIPEHIMVSFDHPADHLVNRIDKNQMMQVLTNLIRNAMEAMEEGGALNIGLSEEAGQAVIRISDTGPGIAEENLEKIFTPFFTTKGVGKGTGLGLPLAYGIVKMHKGKISVTSNSDPGQGPTGTTFTIMLPLSG
jgi:two-component system NtrC family sensor kinase